MSKQLLIYETAVPVSSQRHLNWSVKTGTDYAFAKELNAVPLVAAEIPNVAMEYVIVFAGNDQNVMPLAVLGVHERENLYLTEQGEWQAKYIPAFVRRYPFVFASNAEAKKFTLCIDEEFGGCNQDGIGERLFDAEGQRTQYLESVLAFLKIEQVHFRRTQAFCKKLVELKLLDPMQAQITSNTGQQRRLGGFTAVSRERLKALSDQQLAELAKTDELELVYLHLQSLKNLSSVVARSKSSQTEQDATGQGVEESSATPDAIASTATPA